MATTQRDAGAQSRLLTRLTEARVRTGELFSVVRPDSFYERPIPERHRIVFYLGHLEAFDWNLLHERAAGLRPFHPAFDKLFAFGIDPVGDGLPSDQPSDWPSLAEVRDYSDRVRRALDAELLAAAWKDPGPDWDRGDTSRSLLLNVAIEHRLMHAETLSYMFHQLPLERKHWQPAMPAPAASPASPGMIEIPAGLATLGLARNNNGTFGWDNEYEAHVVEVPAFSIDKYQMTNREFLEFVLAGGYESPAFWTEDDWQWRTEKNLRHPVFWTLRDDRWYFRGMFDKVPLPPEWPVYVSHAEASAYARWAGKALPTEAQWHRAAYGTPTGQQRQYPWGDQFPAPQQGNFDFQSWDPAPVAAFPECRSAFGVEGLVGNGWEWTSSLFEPFCGFKPFSFYPGYSTNFFDGRHYVMKGGSPRTAASMLRRSFRNWFQSRYPYVYAGFRCVAN